MIYTVTLNPALDKTATVPGLTVDSVNRIRDLREDPGGKGINVSKVIAKLGGTSRAVALLGGSVGEKIKAMLAEQGIDVWAFEAMGETRTNLKVVDPELGTHTDINEPGPEAGVAQLDAMLSALVGAIAAGDVVVLSGSLPAGAPVGTYDAWCRACAGAGALVFLDADGEALARGLGACPFLAKPNDAELSRLCGHALETEAQVADEARRLYGVQFHPEVTHTEEGARVLENFLLDICGCAGDWSMEAYADMAVEQIRDQVGGGTVLLGLSGGVDSAVAAALLYRAIGSRLTCVYVDHGFMRAGESDQVVDVFTRVFPVELVHVDASERFFRDLKGVTEPEAKRKIIGRDFVEVFREEARKLGRRDHFAQGTIYPDVIESGHAQGSAVIKSHHNVGGLPAELGFDSLVEPLRMLFKDEVRKLGLTLGLPESLVYRQPFPGPGLAIRVVGELTPDKVRIVRESDLILRQEIAAAGLDKQVSQYFTVLTGAHSVGVMGDERTYAYAVALRAVTTDDFMTADVARLPYDLLGRVATRIVGEVAGCNRVLYDITTKPPASIEWE